MRQRQMNCRSVALGAWVGTLLMLPVQSLYLSIYAKIVSAQQQTTQSQQQLQKLAQSITVKIISGEQGGSGVLIKKEGALYTVLTSQHVLEPSKPHVIQTSDGQNHPALMQKVKFGNKDLTLLQFRASSNYAVASLGNSSILKEGEEVFASGFPFEDNSTNSRGFVFRGGRISQLLVEHPLKGGYQIGYTSNVEKGMSGGPILNSEGKLIGINGIHGQPLWGDPYIYEDGSQPNDELRRQMRISSWGVSIQTLAQLAPQFVPDNILKQQPTATQPSSTPTPQLANKINKIAKDITVLISWGSENGSGVLVAKEGNTYYVLTAGHVVSGNRQLQVVTPDGKQYPIDNSTIKSFSQKEPKVDLALLQFNSNQTYQVATLGNYGLDVEDRVAFTSGWPDSRPANLESSRQLSAGFLLGWSNSPNSVIDDHSLSSGYELVYTNITSTGMSGGPVLDTEGRLIGIHTATEGEDDDEKKRKSPISEKTTQNSRLELGYSLGIPIRTFLAKINQENIKLNLKQETTLPPQLTASAQDEIVKYLLDLKQPPSNADETQWLNYGNKLWRLRRYEQAQQAFEKAYKIKPDFYEAWYAHGTALMLQRKYKEAAKSFDTAIKYNQNSDQAYQTWRQLGNAYYLAENYEKSQEAIDAALKLSDKNDFILHNWRAKVLIALTRYPEALAANDKAIEINLNSAESYTQRSITNEKLSDILAAIADINKAIELQPDLASAYLRRGYLLSLEPKYSLEPTKDKDYNGALKDINKALKFQPKYAWAYVTRGVLYARMGNRQAFTEDFKKALEVRSDNAQIYSERAAAYFILGDTKKGIDDYTEAIRLAPDSASVLYAQRGDALSNHQDNERAIADYNEALHYGPRNIQAYMSRGRAYAKQGHSQQSLDDFYKALQIQPNNYWIYKNRAEARFLLKDKQGAIADYNIAISHDPESAYVYYKVRGDDLSDQKDYAAAIADYNQAIRRKPDYASAYNNRGDARALQKDNVGAIADFTEAIRLNPKNATFYGERGSAYAHQGDYNKAIADFTEAIRLQPDDAGHYKSRADSRANLKDYKGAIADFTEAIRLEPDLASAYNNRGNARIQQKDYVAAIADLTEAIRLQPDLAVAYNNRGNARSQQKDYVAAIADFTEAIRLKPDYALAYDLRADARTAQKNYQGAITDYTEAISLNPKNTPFYKKRGNARIKLQDYKGAIEDYNYVLSVQPVSGIGIQLEIDPQTKVVVVTKVLENTPAQKGGLKVGDRIQVIDGKPTTGISSDKVIDLLRGKTGTQVNLRIAREGKNTWNIILTRAPIVNPELAEVFYNRGLAQAQLQDKQKAREDLQKAAELYQLQNNTEMYKTALGKLQEL